MRIEAEGRTWEFQDDQVVAIGRTPTADVVITGPSTSRAHAELRAVAGEWVLVDLATPHGTFVDGRRITEERIDRPVAVRFGRTADGTPAKLVLIAARELDLSVTRRVAPPVPAAGSRPERTQPPLSPSITLRCEGQERTFEGTEVVRVGRDPELEFVVLNQAVSRLHGRLSLSDAAWEYRDMSSTGTYEDGRPVAHTTITGPRVFRLGDPVRGLELGLAPAGLSMTSTTLRPPPAALPTVPDRRWRLVVAVLVAVAVVAAVAIGAALIGGGDPTGDPGGPKSSPDTTSTTGSRSSSPSGSESASATTSGPAPSPLEVAKSATVLLTANTTTFKGDRVRFRGSGSIIDASGLIMTNAHVAAPEAKGQDLLYGRNDLKDPDYLSVWIGTPDDDAPAKPSYRARVVVVDGYVDVAVLRVYATADGGPLVAPLSLPTVPLGTTTNLRTGDDVTVLGYPGISDSRGVSVTRGIVSTFVPDERIGSDRAEIDTDARIAPGNSGGIAINDAGDVIGIPFATRADPEVGVLSGRVRPIDFAIPVIEAAKNGLPYESPYL